MVDELLSRRIFFFLCTKTKVAQGRRCLPQVITVVCDTAGRAGAVRGVRCHVTVSRCLALKNSTLSRTQFQSVLTMTV